MSVPSRIKIFTKKKKPFGEGIKEVTVKSKGYVNTVKDCINLYYSD